MTNIKMGMLGITVAISEWFRNWLQHIVVGGILAEQGMVGSGVPQGLGLGPLLSFGLMTLTEAMKVL